MKPEDCVPVNKDLLPSSDIVKHLFTARRSIRTYKKQPVDRGTLSELIDTARYAPSGHNIQPVNWLVIEGSDGVKRLSALVIDWMRCCIKEKPELARPMHIDLVVASWEKGIDRVCRNAPHIIANHAPAASMPAAACAIALTYLELAAFSMGLGACWSAISMRRQISTHR